MERGLALLRSLDRPKGGTDAKKRVLALKRIDENLYKAVLGEIGGDRVRITSAGTVGDGASDTLDIGALAQNANVVLVSNSKKSVCRLLKLADASSEHLNQMVAIRLETELPYPVADSTWVCEQRENGNPSAANGLVIATASDEIATAEAELKKKGISCAGIEFSGTGLAELAAVSSPEKEGIAVVRLDENKAKLAIVQAGGLCYFRRLSIDAASFKDPDTLETWVEQAVREIDQSFYDYVLRTENTKPSEILIVGEGLYIEGLSDALGDQLGIQVRALKAAELIETAEASSDAELLAEFPTCIGAIMAAHRRLGGQRATAPPLRSRTVKGTGLNIRASISALVGMNAAVFLVVLAALFGVKSAQINAADRVISEGRPILQDLDRLQEEVDILRIESRKQRAVLDMLMYLAEIFPGNIKVESITMNTQGKVSISGTTKSVEAVTGEVMSAMQASPAFMNVKFLGATQEKEGFGFQITCDVAGRLQEAK